MVRIISALILAVTAACASAQEPAKLVDNPPDRHIVVPGDTLWGISGRFLKEPWRWPEVWHMNKDEIRNPHRIYPGDIVLLDRSTGRPVLKIAKPVNLRLQPQVISEPIKDAIPSIPPHIIAPFISQPLVVEADELKAAPRILAAPDDRVIMGNGDNGYVTGIADGSIANWQIYRPGKALTDPETKEVLGYEAYYLGTAKLVEPGTPATIHILRAKEEITRGDRLIPTREAALPSYVPHKPESDIEGRIIAVYGGLAEAGRLSVVTLNKGSRDGLELGHVVALYRNRIADTRDEENRRELVQLPNERYGLAFVFRTFDKVSYALVMESKGSVYVNDAVRNP